MIFFTVFNFIFALLIMKWIAVVNVYSSFLLCVRCIPLLDHVVLVSIRGGARFSDSDWVAVDLPLLPSPLPIQKVQI